MMMKKQQTTPNRPASYLLKHINYVNKIEIKSVTTQRPKTYLESCQQITHVILKINRNIPDKNRQLKNKSLYKHFCFQLCIKEGKSKNVGVAFNCGISPQLKELYAAEYKTR